MIQKHIVRSYFPLWGVKMESKKAVRISKYVTLAYPSLNKWAEIVKDYVILKYAKYHEKNIAGISPQPCFIIKTELSDGSLFEEVYNQIKEVMYTQIDDAVLNLRLLKKGWFMHPMFIEEVHIPNNGEKNLRFRRAYRQMFLAGLENRFPEFYNLESDDISVEAGKIAPLRQISNLIRKYKKSGSNPSANTAIENFHLAYSYPGHIESEQRLSFLFTTLDAMFGGMSLRRHGKKWKLRNIEMTTFLKERLLEVLKLSNRVHANQDADWMEKTIRPLRNKLAHGKRQNLANESNEVYERLISIIRLLLINFLHFSIKWNEDSEKIIHSFGIDENMSIVETYNKVIELSVLGNSTASNFLCDF